MTREPEQVTLPGYTYIIGRRSNAQVVLYSQKFNGYDLIHIRQVVTKKDGDEVWTRKGIALHPIELQELYKILPTILSQMNHRYGDEAIPRQQRSCPVVSKARLAVSLQNQILLHLVNGLDPEDVREKVMGDNAEERKRFIEAGKALRRCGYLPPRSWVPTPEGRNHAESIRNGISNDGLGMVGLGRKGSGVEPIPFPGPADLSNSL